MVRLSLLPRVVVIARIVGLTMLVAGGATSAIAKSQRHPITTAATSVAQDWKTSGSWMSSTV